MRLSQSVETGELYDLINLHFTRETANQANYAQFTLALACLLFFSVAVGLLVGLHLSAGRAPHEGWPKRQEGEVPTDFPSCLPFRGRRRNRGREHTESSTASSCSPSEGASTSESAPRSPHRRERDGSFFLDARRESSAPSGGMRGDPPESLTDSTPGRTATRSDTPPTSGAQATRRSLGTRRKRGRESSERILGKEERGIGQRSQTIDRGPSAAGMSPLLPVYSPLDLLLVDCN
jgi:hypothetical protein